MPPKHIQILGSSGGQVSTGSAMIDEWGSTRAARLGFRWCFSVWGIGLLTIFLPIVHFLTVPASIVGGPLVAFLIYRFYRNSSDISEVKLNCPACRVEVPVVNGTVDWPLIVRCPACSAELSLEPGSAV